MLDQMDEERQFREHFKIFPERMIDVVHPDGAKMTKRIRVPASKPKH